MLNPLNLLDKLSKKIGLSEEIDKIFSITHNAKIESNFEEISKKYSEGADPFGLNIEKTKDKIKLLLPLYLNYFKTRVIDAQNAQTDRPLMVVSNHSGQIAIDGMLITMAFLCDVNPPRLLRSMVERFVNTIPFFGSWAAEAGAVLGDRSNCQWLLNRGESILVFPEGVKGISKSTSEYYHLQKFTSGFFRLALLSGVDILPIAVIGAEEFYPYVYHPWKLANALNLPALPLSASFLLGPLGLIPLPSPIDIRVGPIYSIPKDLDPDAPDEIVNTHVNNIRTSIEKMITVGLNERRDFFAAIKPTDLEKK